MLTIRPFPLSLFYFLTFSNDLYYNTLRSTSASLQPLLIIVDAFRRTFDIASFGVDGVRSGDLGEGKWVAMILCGTLSGCGGGLWAGE
ncbi:hypothetical protein BC936DRAFT_146032 [Jimgerdemannia flammicorona]|uniref:Uncharacterized protein n=2 Tax=Jimgerdemannia flammicorona TaxID=994334 RepID=A0A433D8I5_9FUNG|nr:hypothetical protein BC936DRAFT_146032 [Jimgerdemannia flammicorona]RUS28671.1 hypothetical protein BC938DRAFT_481582 [Jimgerdemannia flammicorona]